MAKFVVYAHDKTDAESDLIYVCTCDTKIWQRILQVL